MTLSFMEGFLKWEGYIEKSNLSEIQSLSLLYKSKRLKTHDTKRLESIFEMTITKDSSTLF